ncbi:helix-turn-helix domain-containing protein [Sphingobacterium lactis]|uniref:helix-turn-helix domain-containing protein n=1 Tax=Sphingobacterium lactis TaxID=797291 RepID=UPI003EC58F1A
MRVNNINRLLTIDQLAVETQVNRTTIWRWTRQGKIPSYKIGGSYRYSLSEVLDASRTIKIN